MPPETTPEIFSYFAQLIEKETGIQYTEQNAYSLNQRLDEIAKMLSYDSIESFWKDIQIDGLSPQAKKLTLDLATNNETSFFRDPDVFEHFKTHVSNTASEAKGTLEIWCAATSTGQEPYSLAIIMAELRELGMFRQYKIIASDISARALKQAKLGIYSKAEVRRGLSALQLGKYFDPVDADTGDNAFYKIKPELSAHIDFRHINLLDPWPFLYSFDIIFCRNVLIYQNVESKKKIVDRLNKILNPGGLLFLGGAESMVGLSDAFDLEQNSKVSIYRKRS